MHTPAFHLLGAQFFSAWLFRKTFLLALRRRKGRNTTACVTPLKYTQLLHPWNIPSPFLSLTWLSCNRTNTIKHIKRMFCEFSPHSPGNRKLSYARLGERLPPQIVPPFLGLEKVNPLGIRVLKRNLNKQKG